MGAISKSEPIFTKLSTHHSRLNSVRCTKFRANRKIFRDFGALFTLNRTKIYMDAISKSQPIFSKLSIHHSVPHSVLHAKFHANRMIYRDFGGPITLNRSKIYMELYLNLNRFSRNVTHIILDSIQFPLPNFVKIERYIGTLVHHLH